MKCLPATRVPESDLAEFSKLKENVRHEITLHLEIIRFVLEHKSVSAGIKAAAQKWKYAGKLSEPTIKRKYLAWKREGWRGLKNKSKLRRQTTSSNIAPIFKDYALENQRSSKEGHRRMMMEFERGKYFPDVGDWKMVWTEEHSGQAAPSEYPEGWIPNGWHYTNLMKKAKITEHDIKLRRKGRAAARDCLPPVLTTRVGLEVGEVFMCDDVWHDVDINPLGGNRKPEREIEFCCIDLFSGHKVAYGMQPRRFDPTTGRRKNVPESRMLELIAYVLCYKGYRPAGTKFIIEHGTASLKPETQQLITELTGEAVTFTAGGIVSGQLHKGLFPGQSRGNFKLKASLESQHSISHNVMAYLPGQLGRNPDASPEEHGAMVKHTEHLLTCFVELAKTNPERAEALCFDVISDEEYRRAVDSLYHIVSTRHDHDLEGYVKAGLTTTEFRLSERSGDWLNRSELYTFPEEEQLAIRALIRSNPEKYTRSRKQSRLETWNQGESNLITLTKFAMPLIFGKEQAKDLSLQDNGLFQFNNQDFGPDTYIYDSRQILDQDGFVTSLDPKRKYIFHANPFCVDEVFVSDKETREVIGIAPRYGVPCKNDTEAIQRKIGYQIKTEAQLMKPHINAESQRRRMKTRLKNLNQNIDVLDGSPVTEEEIAAAEMVNSVRVTKADRAAAFEHDEPADDDDQISGDELYNLIGGTDAE